MDEIDDGAEMRINISMEVEERDNKSVREPPILLAYVILSRGMRLTEVREILQNAAMQVEAGLIKDGKIGIIS